MVKTGYGSIILRSFQALKNSLLPGGPGSFSIVKPASFNARFTIPLHEYVVNTPPLLEN